MEEDAVMAKLVVIDGRLEQSLGRIEDRLGKLEQTTDMIQEDVHAIKQENALQGQELGQHCEKIKTLEARSWTFGGVTTFLSALAMIFGIKS